MGTGNMEFDNVQLDVEFSQASERDNITSNENIALSFGKLSTWFEALVPEGGSSGQILGWKSSGKAEWINSPASIDEKVKVDKFVSTTQTDYLLTGAVASMATTAAHLVVDNADGVASARMRLQKGTTDTIGQSMIMLGNNIPSGTSKNMQGMILMYSSSDKYGKIVSESLTDNRTWTLPDKTGTIAMTSDITPVNNGKLTIKGGTTSVAEFTANQSGNTDFSIVAGSNVTVTPDATNSKITIASSDTKVTSVDNHYTPSRDTSADKTASASGATAAWSIDVVKGVTLNTDGKGHVTGLSVTSGKIPANPIPSYNVTGSTTWTTADRILVTNAASGNVIKQSSYTIATSVPANALFTDTWIPMEGATSSADGSVGYVNAIPPKNGYNTKYLRADGTWAIPPGTYAHPTYSRTDTASTASPDHGETFTAIDSVTSTNGHVTAVNVKTVTLPAQYVHPGKTQTDTTSTASPAHGGTFTVVDSVTRDTSGHVSGINVKTVTLPSDQNTDTLMTQTNTTGSADYRVLLSGNANDTTETTTGRKSTKLRFNPSSGGLYSFGFLWTDITGQTLDINTLTLSDGTLHSRRFIEKTDGGATNITNIPVTGHPFLLEVDLIRWASTTDYITRQRFTNAANGTYSYVRYCTNGTWGNWTTRKYTDTNTKVTSAANHYTPATASGGDISESASGATAAWSIDVVKGVTLNTDGKGHVTGLSVTSGKIPANPNTDTKVTSADNHYAPATVSGQDKSASASGATAAWSIDVVKGVTLNTDGKGHVTGLSVTSGKIPANPVPSNAVFTDANVTQTPADSTYTNYRPLLIGNSSGTSAGFTPTLTTAGVYATAGIYCQPSSGYVYASDFMTNTYPSGTGSSLSQYGLYLKSYFKCADSSQTVLQYAGYGVRTYSGKITSSDGIAMAVGCGGLTVLGSGESAHNLISLISDDQKISGNTTLNVGGTLNTTFVGNSEVAIVSSDDSIYLITNCQTIANRKPVCLDTNSYFYPGTNKTGSIGTSSYMWNSVYAATIYENGTSLASKYAAIGHTHGLLHSDLNQAATNGTTGGWSVIGIDPAVNGYVLKSIRINETSPNWLSGGYGAGIAFGGADTKGVISMRWDSPVITFAGGNHKSTITSPTWYFKISGTSGSTYNLANFYDSATSRTANTVLAAPNGSAGAATFRKLVAADIPSLNYVPNTQAGVNAAINLLSTGSSNPTLADYYIAQYAGGGTTTTTYHRRPISALWNTFKGLITLETTGSGNAVTAVSIANDGDNNRKITVTKGSTFSLSTHTHNYAGSSSAGGAATSANKLNTNAGASNNPVYFSGGVPVACNVPASGSWFNGGIPEVRNGDGVMEIGKYIDFHATNASTADYDYRIETTTTAMTLTAGGAYNILSIKSSDYAQLSFQTTSSGKAYTSSGIICYPLTASGMTALFSFGGNVVIGGGEAAKTLYDNDYDTIKTTEHETLYLASDSSELHLITDAQSYAGRKVLKILGGQLTKSGGSWISARDNAPVHSYKGGDGTSGSFFPAIFSKSKNGGWAIGTLGNADTLYVSYTKDTDYSSSTNTSTYTIQFPKDSGTLALTTNLDSYLPLSGGTMTGAIAYNNATTRLNSLKNLTNDNVGTSATYFLTITDSWGKGGYTKVSEAKTVLGIGATTSSGTVKHLAYYNGANSITDTGNIIYSVENSTKSRSRTILHLVSTQTVGNDATQLVGGVKGVLSYGDGGPQINFSTSSTIGGGQDSSIIWTDNDGAGYGASWHFVSNKPDWNVVSKRFHARTAISIGTDVPPVVNSTTATNYPENLYVSGTSKFTYSDFGQIHIVRSGSTWAAGIKFSNSNGLLGAIGMTGNVDTPLIRWAHDLSTSYTIIDTSLLNVTETTNLGLDGGTNAFGYVSGLTKAAWNFQQTDGTIIRQYYNANWKTEIFMDYRTGQMSTRGKNNGTWQDWRIHLDSGNYTSYALATTTKYAGSSSTGGPATYVELPRVTADSKSFPGQNKVGFREYSNTSTNTPSSAWYHIISMQGADTKYGTQLALGMTATAVYYRNYNNTAWIDWQPLGRFTATPTTGQVVITDGTTGGIKSSGNTITATPSGKVNTNWGTASDRTTIVTKGWMSYWDGSYDGSASNLTYCNKGAFGTIITKNAGDYVLSHGNLNGTIGADSPAADVKTFFMTSSVPTGTSSIGYNTNGKEYTLIFGKGVNTAGYGAVLRFGYDSLYPEVLRIKSGTWESSDWEKISAGKADIAENVSGTVAIAHGGTGATDRLAALKNLTIDNVGTSATYFLTITNSWGKGGYTSVAQAKTVLGMGTLASRSYVEITSITTVTSGKKYTCTANTNTYKTFLVIFSYGSTYMAQWFTVTGSTAAYYPIFASMSTDAEAVLSVQCGVSTSATITFQFSNGANSPVVERVIGFNFGG